MQENEDVLDWDFCLENPPFKPARVVEVIFEKRKLTMNVQQDSEETMLASEQWFLYYGEDENMCYGKLIDLIGTVLNTNSADVLRKHPKVIKKSLKTGGYVFLGTGRHGKPDLELKYRPSWNAALNAIWIGTSTGQSRKERKLLEQEMKNNEFWEYYD